MNIASEKFDLFVELNDTYRAKHPKSKDLANLVLSDIVQVEKVIEAMQKAGEKEIDFEVDYTKPYAPIFKGFEYLETA
jgi:hypothetical protein